MRRVVLLCLGVVSCASPDVPRVDGVPEDPGHRPPTLPVDMTPEAPAVPNDSETTAGTVTDDGEGVQADAGAAVGVTPVPTGTAPTPPSPPAPPPSGSASSAGDETLGASTSPSLDSAEATEPAPGLSDAGAVAPCEPPDAGPDAGFIDAGIGSAVPGDCNGH